MLETTVRSDTRPLNVLQVVGICGGGLGRHVRALCEDLTDEGHGVTVAYAPHDVDHTFQKFVAERGEEIRFVPLEVPREIALAADLRGMARLIGLVKMGGPFDVIHGHSAKGGAIARIVGSLSRVPTVYTPHSFISSSPKVSRRRAAFYNHIERILGNLATSRMIAVSEGERAFALELGLVPDDRTLVLPNGIEEGDLERRGGGAVENGFREKPLTFGTTLRLSSQKAPEILIDAFARLTRSLPDLPTRLIIAGDGELRDDVEARIRQSGLEDRVELLGWRADTKAVMRRLDVFVLPSLYEGASYSLLEAMAAGLPVVSTKVFGTDETLSKVPGNVLVAPGDARRLAHGMEQIATTSEPENLRHVLREIGKKNRGYVGVHLRQRDASRRVIDLYRSLGPEKCETA